MKTILTVTSLVLSFAAGQVSAQSPYISNSVNMTAFTGRNELIMEYGYAFKSGYDYNFSYSITRNIALMTGGYRNKQKYSEETYIFGDTKYYEKDNEFYEVGVGWYKYSSNRININIKGVFAGYGEGNGHAKEYFPGLEPTIAQGNYSRFYIQAHAGHLSELYAIAVGVKFVWLYFPEYMYIDYLNGIDDTAGTVKLNIINSEPAISFYAGPKCLRFFIQLHVSMPLVRNIKNTYETGDGFETYTSEGTYTSGVYLRLGAQGWIPFKRVIKDD